MPMSKVAVLVVEDMPQARATAVGIMQALGCTVFDAYNGHQALKLLQAHPETMVLFADVRMPGMSGPELAEAAQRLRPDLRSCLPPATSAQRICRPTSPLSQSPGGRRISLRRLPNPIDPAEPTTESCFLTKPLSGAVSPMRKPASLPLDGLKPLHRLETTR